MYFLVEYKDSTEWLLKNISFKDDLIYSTLWVIKGGKKYFEDRGSWLLHYVKYITPIEKLPDWAPENWPVVDNRLVLDYVITDKDIKLTFSDGSKLKFERDRRDIL